MSFDQEDAIERARRLAGARPTDLDFIAKTSNVAPLWRRASYTASTGNHFVEVCELPDGTAVWRVQEEVHQVMRRRLVAQGSEESFEHAYAVSHAFTEAREESIKGDGPYILVDERGRACRLTKGPQ